MIRCYKISLQLFNKRPSYIRVPYIICYCTFKIFQRFNIIFFGTEITINKERNNFQKPINENPSALYLRIDDLSTELYNKAKRVLDIFEGSTPVIFYLTNSGRKVKAPSSMWVTLNDVMIKELKFQLGDKNVAAK